MMVGSAAMANVLCIHPSGAGLSALFGGETKG
jgi:hypothetical protein